MDKKEKQKKERRKRYLLKKEKLLEAKKIVTTGFITALSLLIALTWKDVINQYIEELAAFSPVRGLFVTATLVTIICVIGILIITSFFKQE